MRPILLALALAVLALPAAARAAYDLRLELFDGASEPGAHLEVPALSIAGVPMLAVDTGGGAPGRRQRVEPALALILGIIPGFGLGHLLAGSEQWVIWLIADIVIFLVWPGGFFFVSDRGNAYGFLGLLVLVERIFEGISAYQAAGGGPILRSERGFAAALPSPSELARPVGMRSALATAGL
jgi:hypothetical protein